MPPAVGKSSHRRPQGRFVLKPADRHGFRKSTITLACPAGTAPIRDAAGRRMPRLPSTASSPTDSTAVSRSARIILVNTALTWVSPEPTDPVGALRQFGRFGNEDLFMRDGPGRRRPLSSGK